MSLLLVAASGLVVARAFAPSVLETMQAGTVPPSTQASRRNAFGFLRLLFASLVIVSHSLEMLDGNQAREPLHNLTGSLSFGRLAVDGFFLISGYLITSSFNSDARGYLWKRVLRIYPAFLVCSLLCIFVVAPLAGGAGLTPADAPHALLKLLTLKAPIVPGVFQGAPYPALNGSMWTISYEFRCYLIAACLGLIGTYRKPRFLAIFTAALLALSLLPSLPIPRWVEATFGETHQAISLTSTFMVGACFKWLPIRLKPMTAVLCAAALALALVIPMMLHRPVLGPIAELLLVLLGGYVLFWFAFYGGPAILRRINADDDVSYGVYLYAWPIGALTIWWWHGIPALLLMVTTLVLSLACGWISWKLVEQPAMSLKSKPFGRILARAPAVSNVPALRDRPER